MTVEKPTPTQAEIDAHRLGKGTLTHEPDGSPEQNIHAALLPATEAAPLPPPAPEPTPTQAEIDEARLRKVMPNQRAAIVTEEKAAEATTERSTYKTRRAKAADEEDKT